MRVAAVCAVSSRVETPGDVALATITLLVLPVVSLRAKLTCGNEACSAGLDFPITVTVIESVSSSARPLTEIVPAVVESEAAPDKPAVPLVADTVFDYLLFLSMLLAKELS